LTTLVTGAGGFVGGRVVARLAAAGEPVRALDIAWGSGACGTGPQAGVERVTASILDPAALAEAMRGVRAVVHAAAIAQLWSPGRFDYDRVNGLGTARVLAAARRAGASVVHVSSYVTLIDRATPPGATLDETVEVPPSRLLGDYPRTKRQADLFALSAAATGQRVVIVMPSAPVGAGDANLTPPTRMLRDLATGRIPALLDCRLNLVDVEAVAAAIMAARDRGTSGARYLLTGEDLAMREIAEAVARATGRPAPRRTVPMGVALAAARAEAVLARMTGRPPTAPLTGVRLAARPCRFDSARARAALGFAPRPFADCLAEALGWLGEAGHLQG
jgi:dihydroflavonol-4-reductase